MRQWRSYQLHLPTVHPFIQIGIFFKAPFSNCPTCLPPRAESCGGTDTTWMQITDPAGWRSMTRDASCYQRHRGGICRTQGLIQNALPHPADDRGPLEAGCMEALRDQDGGLRAGSTRMGLNRYLYQHIGVKISPSWLDEGQQV